MLSNGKFLIQATHISLFPFDLQSSFFFPYAYASCFHNQLDHKFFKKGQFS